MMIVVNDELPLGDGARIVYFLYTENDYQERILLEVFDKEKDVKEYMSDPKLACRVHYVSQCQVNHLKTITPDYFLK